MTTQTQQSSTAQQQGTYHFVITLQMPIDGGFSTGTWTNALTPRPGETRADLFKNVRDEIARIVPEYRDANVVFWALERNDL